MRTFVRVAEVGSFSGAARALGLSAPVVSRQVADLEAHLGIRLFNRTTRQVELSEAGTEYYPQCIEVLERIAALEAEVSGHAARPSGVLRVSMPMDFGRLFLGPAIREFLSRAPAVRLEIRYEDREAQLLQEQVDVAIRIGHLDDSSLVARRLGEACIACYASPDYLAQHGSPGEPADLEDHQLIDYSLARAPGRWHFEGAPELDYRGRWRLSCNNGRALAAAAARGLGIVRLPEFLVQDYLAKGRLTEILSAHRSPPLQISAVTLHRRFRPAKTRAFIDFLVEYFERRDDWAPRRA
jgi:DNA-binding transcriptional LysR family regulator